MTLQDLREWIENVDTYGFDPKDVQVKMSYGDREVKMSKPQLNFTATETKVIPTAKIKVNV